MTTAVDSGRGTFGPVPPSEVLAHAHTLRERAQEHKRAERREKRRARKAMDELRAFCEQHGIAFELIDRDHKEVRVA